MWTCHRAAAHAYAHRQTDSPGRKSKRSSHPPTAPASRTTRSPTLKSAVHHTTSNPAAAWLCMSKRPFSVKPDKMQKDQSRCAGKITSPESVTICYTKARLKTGAVQLFGDINVWRQLARKKINTIFYDISVSHGQCVCNVIQMRAVTIRFGYVSYTGMIECPQIAPRAASSATSRCVIFHFVGVIRRTKSVRGWQGGLRVTPVSETMWSTCCMLHEESRRDVSSWIRSQVNPECDSGGYSWATDDKYFNLIYHKVVLAFVWSLDLVSA